MKCFVLRIASVIVNVLTLKTNQFTFARFLYRNSALIKQATSKVH